MANGKTSKVAEMANALRGRKSKEDNDNANTHTSTPTEKEEEGSQAEAKELKPGAHVLPDGSAITVGKDGNIRTLEQQEAEPIMEIINQMREENAQVMGKVAEALLKVSESLDKSNQK